MLLELAGKIAAFIYSIPFKLLIIISSFFLSFSIEILNWVLSGNFIPFPDTIPGPCTGSPCAGNPIIEIGWTLTRDLANMLFIVILVYMGIRTALRLGEEYKVQKLLPRMIIIALLINFTPVIAGIFVDASNILMNFFIGNLGGFNDFFRVAGAQTAILDQNFRSGFSILAILPMGFQGIILGIINFLSAAVILLFAILFLMRHVAIWTLVILSPIAFAGYILPETRGWWRTWWHQFLQWCFIGVTAGFFLYLGNHMLILMPALIRSTPPAAAGDWWNTSMENFLIAVMPFGISLIFLWIGLFMGFAGSAMGASTAIGFVQKQANVGLVRVKAEAGKAVSKVGARVREYTPGFVREGAKALEKAPDVTVHWGAGEKGIGGWAKRTAAGLTNVATTVVPVRPLMGGIRATGRAVAGTVIDARREEINKGTSEGDKIQDVDRLVSEARSASGDRKAGLIKSAIKKGGAFKLAVDKILSNEEIIELITKAVEAGDIPTAESLRKGFITKLGTDKAGNLKTEKELTSIDARTGLKLSKEDEEKGYKSFTHKLIAEAKESDIKEFSKGFFKGPEAMEIIQKFWNDKQVRAAAQEFGNTFVDTFMIEAEKRETAPGKGNAIEWFVKNNQNLALYLTGNAAQDSGLSLPGGGMKREDLQKRIQELRMGPPSLSPIQKTLAAGSFERMVNERLRRDPGFFGGPAPADFQQLFKKIIDKPEEAGIQSDVTRRELANMAQQVLLRRTLLERMNKQISFRNEIYKEIAINLPEHRGKSIENITKTDIRRLSPVQRTQGFDELFKDLPLNPELDIARDLAHMKSADDSETKKSVKAIYDNAARNLQPFRGGVGTHEERTCPSCGRRMVRPGLANCPYCRQSLTTPTPPQRICRSCGGANPGTATTCAGCGRPV